MIPLRSVRHLAATFAAAAVITLAVGGCAAKSGLDASPVATTTVDLPPSYTFAPAAIQVNAGSTVTWTNLDNFTHSVHFLDGGLPTDPMVMQPGQTVTFTFSGAGTFHYECHFHPQNMQGTVTVTG